MKHYFRYADDFVIVHPDRVYLERQIARIGDFLRTELALQLHPNKVEIRKFNQGIDFLGYVILPHHIVLRTKTKRRMFKKLLQRQNQLSNEEFGSYKYNQSLQSYLGILKHCNAYDLENILKNSFFNTSTSC